MVKYGQSGGQRILEHQSPITIKSFLRKRFYLNAQNIFSPSNTSNQTKKYENKKKTIYFNERSEDGSKEEAEWEVTNVFNLLPELSANAECGETSDRAPDSWNTSAEFGNVSNRNGRPQTDENNRNSNCANDTENSSDSLKDIINEGCSKLNQCIGHLHRGNT